MDDIGIERSYRDKIYNIIKSGYKNELDRDKLYEIVRMNYSLMS